MPAEHYTLDFNGYWVETQIDDLPARSGIYGVYTCTHSASLNKVTLSKLIYIGEAGNIKSRVADHEKWQEWRNYRERGEVLCFNAAPIFPQGARERAEAAVIHQHKPLCNTQYKDSFPFDRTTVTITGTHYLLAGNFSLLRTHRA